MIPRHNFRQEDHVDSWLMSYADMITLLLAFFIIFVATSVPKEDNFDAVTKGMKQRFGTLAMETPFEGMYRSIVGTIADNKADRNVAVERTEHGLRVELSSLQFFPAGSADIPAEQLPLLKSVADTLKQGALTGYIIEVDGFTSDEPLPKGAAFASNWELAGARATRIVRLLEQEGIKASRLRAMSFGPVKPLVPNEDAKGNPIPENQARNQRVVIRLERDESH